MTDESDQVSRHAVIAETAYLPKSQRQSFVDKYYNGEYSLLDDYSGRIHSVYKHNPSGNVVFGIRGTDASNSQGGRIKDLATDVMVTLGIEKLSKRYNDSEKMLKRLQADFKDKKITLASHSLGSAIAGNLSYKHDIDSYGFNGGASPLHASSQRHNLLHPKNKEKKRRNRMYLTLPNLETGVDLLSISNALNPTQNIKFVEQKKDLSKSQAGVLYPHSLHHFFPDSATS